MNTDNLTPYHVDRAIDRALKKFERYEKKVDFSDRTASDNLYRDYQAACQYAQDIAKVVSHRVVDTERLP